LSSERTGIAHWDEIEPQHLERGQLGCDRYDLGTAAGSVDVGVKRVLVRPGKLSSPVHVEGDAEEIFYVLAGSGLSWQDGSVHEVGAGDCIVHLASAEAHTLVGGPEGLDVLAFGERVSPPHTHIPRSGVIRMGVTLAAPELPHQFELEGALPELELAAPSQRPATIVNAAEVAGETRDGATVARTWRNLGRAAGSVRTGVKLIETVPGKLAVPPHCHSAEEELFVVLDGEGHLLLGDDEFPVRRGSVVARPPGTGVAHSFRAGGRALTFLAYGTREPDDSCFYPRSGKIFFSGLGLVGRLEPLDFWDGED
jgi:uncharacterized cupin superfamily protein